MTGRTAIAVCLVALGVGLAAGVAALMGSTGPAEQVPDSASDADVPACVSDEAVTPTPPSTPTPATPDPAPGTPLLVDIPAVGVRAQVVPVRLSGSALAPPDDVTKVGWWEQGALAGAERGTVLLTGHTWSRGDGVFDELGTLARGDLIEVLTDEGTLTYRVEAVVEYTRARLAELAPQLFSQSVSPQLVLTTCSGFDGSAYLTTTVVVALPEPAGE